jgi:hypothetical protein
MMAPTILTCLSWAKRPAELDLAPGGHVGPRQPYLARERTAKTKLPGTAVAVRKK